MENYLSQKFAQNITLAWFSPSGEGSGATAGGQYRLADPEGHLPILAFRLLAWVVWRCACGTIAELERTRSKSFAVPRGFGSREFY